MTVTHQWNFFEFLGGEKVAAIENCLEFAIIRWATGFTTNGSKIGDEPGTNDDIETTIIQYYNEIRCFTGLCQVFTGNDRLKFLFSFILGESIHITGWSMKTDEHYRPRYYTAHPAILNAVQFLIEQFRYGKENDPPCTFVYRDYQFFLGFYLPNPKTGLIDMRRRDWAFLYDRNKRMPYLFMLVELIREKKITKQKSVSQIDYHGLHLDISWANDELAIEGSSYHWFVRGAFNSIIQKFETPDDEDSTSDYKDDDSE